MLGNPAPVSRETHSAYDPPRECGWKLGTVSRETDKAHNAPLESGHEAARQLFHVKQEALPNQLFPSASNVTLNGPDPMGRVS